MIVVDKVLEELVTQGVNALVQTVTDNVKLIRGIDSEIIDLTSDIETFNARLGEAFKNPRANDHKVLRVIVKKFRIVVDEAKDTIANYVVLNKRHGDHFISKSLDWMPLCGKVSAYASEIKSIRAKMKAIRQEHERELLYLMQFEIKGQDNNVKTLQARPTAEKNKVFGFEKDLEAVRIRLLEASNSFVVIPIVGMTGTGKTTFAFKLFEDSSIHSNSIRIWVPVSKRCDRKQKFISIIYQITKSTEDLTNKTEEMLKDTIRDLLTDQVYFIILDDVWEKTDWDSLQAAFPNNMNGSKILVTTRHDNVVDSTWKPHNLEKLSDDDGWKLIKNNVFGTEGCSDQEFEKHGKQIAKKCNGLPLALVVVAGLFLNCYNQRRSLYPFGKHIHSLLLSSTQKSESRFAQEKLATIPNNFPLLRVLNIESINCDGLPIEVFGLYLLKYLAITSNLNLLPESFKNLRELEALVIKTTARTLEIEGGIWNMEKLRHVRTNTSAQLPFPPKIKSGGKTIRTLSTISPTSCTKETFSRTPNLQKLGVRGNLSQLLEEKKNICLLNNIGMLKCLENLKLYGQYDKVLIVPVLDKFACKLKKLSFSGTLFEWKGMVVLGSLKVLEVLKLDDYAFKGENWELGNDIVFRRLQYLRIGRTNLVTWKLATHNSFPALQGLVLRNCSSLERIPENFAKVHTLMIMELFHMSENAVKSANEIKENVDRRIKLVITFEKREGPMTAAMDMVIKQEVSEAVDRVVQTVAAYNKNYNVKQSWGAPRVVLDSEIQDLTSDIETFNARLVEASKNPFACVDVLIVKNFQTVVNKAGDAVAHYIALKKMYEEDKALRTLTFQLPINIKKLKSCESEIQSVKKEVNMIRQEHENDLQSLNKYKTGVLLSLQREGVTVVFDKVIEDIKVVVNKLVQIVEENVNLVCYVESVHAEINEMTSHIQTFKEKLVEACKNPNANEHRVLRIVVKKFRMLVNEAEDAKKSCEGRLEATQARVVKGRL
nr:uncharacterized protein LOC109181763 [Ipomoea trifida]